MTHIERLSEANWSGMALLFAITQYTILHACSMEARACAMHNKFIMQQALRARIARREDPLGVIILYYLQ